jgi:hypothetical protein
VFLLLHMSAYDGCMTYTKDDMLLCQFHVPLAAMLYLGECHPSSAATELSTDHLVSRQSDVIHDWAG